MNEMQKSYWELIEKNNFQTIQVSKGDFLFKEGETDNFVYFINEGEVLIMKENLILWHANSGELIGLSSFFSTNENYGFTAKASQDCTVYLIPNELLSEKITKDFKFSHSLINMMCDRISRIDQRVAGFLELPSKTRLIRTLVAKSKDTGSKVIPYHINEIAAFVGVSVRIVNSIISELEERKMIRRLKDRLEILDLRGLEIISKA